MSTATLTTRHPLARRGAAYTSLLKEIDRRGDSALHKAEREQLIDCADALLFDEETAASKVTSTLEMMRGLADSERWTESSVDDAIALLEQIGSNQEEVA